MQEEIDFIKGIEKSLEKDYQELKKRYDQQLKDVENMRYNNSELIKEKERLYKEYKEKVEQISVDYNEAKTESQREMNDIRKKYDKQINELKDQLWG